MTLFFVYFISLFHAFPLDPPLKLKSMLLKVRPMLFSSGPLMASLKAAMDADAGCLIMLCALSLGRGIVILDCGYKWLPGGLNFSFWIRQKWRIQPKLLLFSIFILSCLYFFCSFLFWWLLIFLYRHMVDIFNQSKTGKDAWALSKWTS